MSELKRLRDQESDRVARLLLDAGHFDDPPRKRLDRIVAGIAGAGAVAGAKTAAASGALAAAPIAAKSATPLALVFKWLGAGMLAGAVVSGGAAGLQPGVGAAGSEQRALPPSITGHDPVGMRDFRPSFEPEQKPRVDPVAAIPGAVSPERVSAAPSPVSAPRAAQVAAPAVADRAPAAVTQSTPANASVEAVAKSPDLETPANAQRGIEPERSHALREELAALAFAKSALNRGSPRIALSAVHAYRKRFPAGALTREATYIEMEAQHAVGNRSRAVELAGELAPGVTPNAERAREILKGE